MIWTYEQKPGRNSRKETKSHEVHRQNFWKMKEKTYQNSFMYKVINLRITVESWSESIQIETAMEPICFRTERNYQAGTLYSVKGYF